MASSAPPSNPVEIFPGTPQTSAYFARSVSVSGSRALIGDPDDREKASQAGAAYLIDVNNPTGPKRKITAFDAKATGRFGYAVDIDGDFAIVGARQDSQRGFSAGAAYLLDLRDPNNIVQHKLLPDDVGGVDVFGEAVAISGRRAIVGSIGDDDINDNSGAAYVFDFTDLNHIITKKILPPEPLVQSLFGGAVDIDGTRAIVGARAASGGVYTGRSYIFDLSDLDHISATTLTPSDGFGGNEFGGAVAIKGSFALVGAPQNNLGSGSNPIGSGQAYLFDLSAPGAPQEYKLLPSGRTRGDGIGEALALAGRTAFVGAPGQSNYAGAVYAFDFSNLANITQQRLAAFNGDANDAFGLAVAAQGASLIVGAPSRQPTGVAYVYAVPEPSAWSLSMIFVIAMAARSRINMKLWGGYLACQVSTIVRR
jgi:hypothetical protein